MLKFKFVAGHM